MFLPSQSIVLNNQYRGMFQAKPNVQMAKVSNLYSWYIYNLLILPYIIPWYICIRTCIDSAGQRSALHFMNIHDIIWYTVRNTPKPFIFVTAYSKYSTLTCVSETHSIWVPQIVLDCKSIPSQVRKSHTLFPVCDAQTTLAYGMYRSLSVQKVSLTMSYVHSWS